VVGGWREREILRSEVGSFEGRDGSEDREGKW